MISPGCKAQQYEPRVGYDTVVVFCSWFCRSSYALWLQSHESPESWKESTAVVQGLRYSRTSQSSGGSVYHGTYVSKRVAVVFYSSHCSTGRLSVVSNKKQDNKTGNLIFAGH